MDSSCSCPRRSGRMLRSLHDLLRDVHVVVRTILLKTYYREGCLTQMDENVDKRSLPSRQVVAQSQKGSGSREHCDHRHPFPTPASSYTILLIPVCVFVCTCNAFWSHSRPLFFSIEELRLIGPVHSAQWQPQWQNAWRARRYSLQVLPLVSAEVRLWSSLELRRTT